MAPRDENQPDEGRLNAAEAAAAAVAAAAGPRVNQIDDIYNDEGRVHHMFSRILNLQILNLRIFSRNL